ncbi:hypothetical protein HY227_02555 [Candidatus Wolfebacteria bacterium]|nr:hypothetical protein [Candidatus Wolfebacteria bacterium]
MKNLKLAIIVGIVGMNILALGFGTLTFAQRTDSIVTLTKGDLIREIIRRVYIIFFFIAVIFVFVAAFYYLFAMGDPEKIKKAKNMIVCAAVAIVMMFLADIFKEAILFIQDYQGDSDLLNRLQMFMISL